MSAATQWDVACWAVAKATQAMYRFSSGPRAPGDLCQSGRRLQGPPEREWNPHAQVKIKGWKALGRALQAQCRQAALAKVHFPEIGAGANGCAGGWRRA